MQQTITAAQKADLQQQTWAVVERFRQKHGVSQGVIFEFLISFAWGYARRQGESNEAITNRARARFEACELAYQKSLTTALGGDLEGGRG
jgi:hypothetical protein